MPRKKDALLRPAPHKKTYGFACAYLAKMRPKKVPYTVSIGHFLQPILSQIFIGKTASHRKRTNFVRDQGAVTKAC